MQKKPLIIITGPTAAGKTDISIRLAADIQGEIISADSVQVYKYMDIGSAKIKKEEMQGIPHFLIDELMPDEEFNVVIFQRLARNYMEKIYGRGHIPILVGGTGFYIQSVVYGIEFDETNPDSSIRGELERLAGEKGTLYLHHMLSEVDEEAAKAIHPNNVKRTIRALEYYRQTGLKISKHNAEQKKKKSPYNYLYFVINQDRKLLYERIEQRVEKMLEEGLVREVEKLLSMGYSRELVSMQGLGYKEIASCLAGECTLEDAVYQIKRDTRHFAKRQLTWFKREESVIWMNVWEYRTKDEMLLEMKKIIAEHGISFSKAKEGLELI